MVRAWPPGSNTKMRREAEGKGQCKRDRGAIFATLKAELVEHLLLVPDVRHSSSTRPSR